MHKPIPVMKNFTIRLPEAQIKHIKKRAREQKHYKQAEVVRRLVDADMAQPTN